MKVWGSASKLRIRHTGDVYYSCNEGNELQDMQIELIMKPIDIIM